MSVDHSVADEAKVQQAAPVDMDSLCNEFLATWNPPGPEPILQENADRFLVDPIKHPDLMELYKTHFSMFWSPDDIDLSHDKKEFDLMPQPAQDCLLAVLSYFATADAQVMDNLGANFGDELKIIEAKLFYKCQDFFECIHSRVYSKLLMTFVTDPAELKRHGMAMIHSPAVKRKFQWAQRWMSRDRPFVMRLFAFWLVEALFFPSSFAVIWWVCKEYGLKGLMDSNTYIARDESMHVEFAAVLYLFHIVYKLPLHIIVAMTRDCIESSEDFYIDFILPVNLPGMNAGMMKEYVRTLANKWLAVVGAEPYYVGVTDPFQWMESLSIRVDTSNFERHNASYQKRKHQTSAKTASSSSAAATIELAAGKLVYANSEPAGVGSTTATTNLVLRTRKLDIGSDF